jgi:chromosome condensin MukBEF complex kleisin-like MukF subunit
MDKIANQVINYKYVVCTYSATHYIFAIPNNIKIYQTKCSSMTGALSIRSIIAQYLSKFSVTKTEVDQTIRFSPADIYANQKQIVALWRELNQRNMKPTAKTFLGKIVSIKIHPTGTI